MFVIELFSNFILHLWCTRMLMFSFVCVMLTTARTVQIPLGWIKVYWSIIITTLRFQCFNLLLILLLFVFCSLGENTNIHEQSERNHRQEKGSTFGQSSCWSVCEERTMAGWGGQGCSCTGSKSKAQEVQMRSEQEESIWVSNVCISEWTEQEFEKVLHWGLKDLFE